MPVDMDRFQDGQERYSIENEIVSFLYEQDDRAFNVHEVTVEVMDTGWSESNVESAEFEDFVGCVLDLATVSSILDRLVDHGQVERRILDTGEGERSYYRAR